jgi:hypothetical protein
LNVLREDLCTSASCTDVLLERCRYVIAHAQHYLLSALGLEMRSMAKAAPRGREGGPAADEGSQQFVLRSAVPQALRAGGAPLRARPCSFAHELWQPKCPAC